MANCAKCNGSSFGIQTISPTGARYKLNMVKCSSCGAPAGVVEFLNSGALFDDVKEMIGKLNDRVDNVERMVRQIGQVLSRR